MRLVSVIALVLSGAVILGSVLLPEMGFRRSAFSRKGAALLTGLGIGFACGMIVFWGFSNGNFIESIITGVIAAMVAGLTQYFTLGKWPKFN